ncbi:Kinesin-like protein kif19 [Sorochytrium milnesiophthora]
MTQSLVLTDPFDEDDILRQKRHKDRVFTFDRVFGDQATQAEVYDGTAKRRIDDVLNGAHVTVFAYGATGSGKTYTMFGTDSQPGLVEQTLTDLYTRLPTTAAPAALHTAAAAATAIPAVVVSLSYIEIYNENIRDLLAGKPDFLELREDPHRGAVIAGLKQVETHSLAEMMDFLRRGHKCRITESTAANAVSSRSHAIVQVTITRRFAEGKKKRVQKGYLSLIDLAGSERANATQNTGVRLVESSMINRSLLALGNCINALSSPVAPAYVNYRDSKLTRILKSSLRGNDCRTVMIANLCPNVSAFDETCNTIKYASRAKNIPVVRLPAVVAGAADSSAGTLAETQSEDEHDEDHAHRSKAPAKQPTANRVKLSRVKLKVKAAKPKPPRTLQPTMTDVAVKQKPRIPPIAAAADDHQRLPYAQPSWSRVEGLLQTHIDTQRRLLDLDEIIIDRNAQCEQRQAEIASLEVQLEGLAAVAAGDGSAHDTGVKLEDSAAKQAEVQAHIRRLQVEVQDILSKQAHDTAQKTQLQAVLERSNLRITRLKEEFARRKVAPGHAGTGGAVYPPQKAQPDWMQHLLQEFHLALDNLDLELAAAMTADSLRRKDLQMQNMQLRLTLYERLLEYHERTSGASQEADDAAVRIIKAELKQRQRESDVLRRHKSVSEQIHQSKSLRNSRIPLVPPDSIAPPGARHPPAGDTSGDHNKLRKVATDATNKAKPPLSTLVVLPPVTRP